MGSALDDKYVNDIDINATDNRAVMVVKDDICKYYGVFDRFDRLPSQKGISTRQQLIAKG